MALLSVSTCADAARGLPLASCVCVRVCGLLHLLPAVGCAASPAGRGGFLALRRPRVPHVCRAGRRKRSGAKPAPRENDGRAARGAAGHDRHSSIGNRGVGAPSRPWMVTTTG
ncbi:uncharacterized protein Tco025E_09977 [Trypanosoma conorhini]|uniref:Uncharacterized protein n=1 Tax=Trypanosoma conorhini TaxID=83891 RepID=A0A3R7M3Q2_9TRYP|nr:uncharacterized protein Tco025E_09977 [Trypanosoma conorhini]RNE95589.1 hypothetical protein Tco025E_09977 [Trypanosoma conorhini]